MTISPQDAGAIIRAAKDKADREIARSTLSPATVVTIPDGGPLSTSAVVVHIDGDPPSQTREVVNLGGVPVQAGQRVMVEFTPPHGGLIRGIAGTGDAAGTPAIRVTNLCGNSGPMSPSPTVVESFESAQVTLCCVEFAVGGASADVSGPDTWIEATMEGIYALHFEADIFPESIDPLGATDQVRVRVEVSDLADNLRFEAAHDALGSLTGYVRCDRAALPLHVGDRIRVFANNATPNAIQVGFVWGSMEIIWLRPGRPELNDCSTGGGG